MAKSEFDRLIEPLLERWSNSELYDYIVSEAIRRRRTVFEQILYMLEQFMAAQHNPPELKPNGSKRLY